jgi:hypothetical protein
MKGRIEKYMIERFNRRKRSDVSHHKPHAARHSVQGCIFIGDSHELGVEIDSDREKIKHASSQAKGGNANARSQLKSAFAKSCRHGSRKQHGVVAGAKSPSGLRD